MRAIGPFTELFPRTIFLVLEDQHAARGPGYPGSGGEKRGPELSRRAREAAQPGDFREMLVDLLVEIARIKHLWPPAEASSLRHRDESCLRGYRRQPSPSSIHWPDPRPGRQRILCRYRRPFYPPHRSPV